MTNLLFQNQCFFHKLYRTNLDLVLYDFRKNLCIASNSYHIKSKMYKNNTYIVISTCALIIQPIIHSFFKILRCAMCSPDCILNGETNANLKLASVLLSA